MTLPSKLASEIIDLEDQASRALDKNLLEKILWLYSQAIEYYESINDKKYLSYLSRMRSFISCREVKALLRIPSNGSSISSLADRSATKTIELNDQESSIMFKQARENIKSQCISLPKRIQERKASKSFDSLPFTTISNRLNHTFDLYESRIQEVIEWFVVKKQEVICEIEEKYSIEGQNLLMNAEIIEAVKLLEEKKQDKIKELRHIFLRTGN